MALMVTLVFGLSKCYRGHVIRQEGNEFITQIHNMGSSLVST